MRYFARICAHARSWRKFAKCRLAHFPSFFSVHVDTYDIVSSELVTIPAIVAAAGDATELFDKYNAVVSAIFDKHAPLHSGRVAIRVLHGPGQPAAHGPGRARIL